MSEAADRVLTKHEKSQPVSRKLKKHYDVRLDELRKKGDEIDRDELERHQGKIAECKRIIQMLDEDVKFKIESNDVPQY